MVERRKGVKRGASSLDEERETKRIQCLSPKEMRRRNHQLKAPELVAPDSDSYSKHTSDDRQGHLNLLKHTPIQATPKSHETKKSLNETTGQEATMQAPSSKQFMALSRTVKSKVDPAAIKTLRKISNIGIQLWKIQREQRMNHEVASIVATLKRNADAPAQQTTNSTTSGGVKKPPAPRPDDSIRYKPSRNKFSEPKKRSRPVFNEEDSDDKIQEEPKKRLRTAVNSTDHTIGRTQTNRFSTTASNATRKPLVLKQAVMNRSIPAQTRTHPRPQECKDKNEDCVPLKRVKLEGKLSVPTIRAQPAASKSTQADEENSGPVVRGRRSGTTQSGRTTTGSSSVRQISTVAATPGRPIAASSTPTVTNPPARTATTRSTPHNRTGPPENRYQLTANIFSRRQPRR